MNRKYSKSAQNLIVGEFLLSSIVLLGLASPAGVVRAVRAKSSLRVALRSRVVKVNFPEFGKFNGKRMLFSVEQAFVGREEIRSPLKTPAGEASQ